MTTPKLFKAFPFALFPDQGLCFWLGFLSAAIWLGGFVFCFDALVSLVGCGTPSYEFLQTLLLRGAAGGFFAVLVGYMLRNVQPLSPHRWIWLSFVIPMCTFILSSSSGKLSSQLQINGTTGITEGLPEIFYALCFHGTAALMIGVTVVTVIGACKLVRHVVSLFWKTSNPFEKIDVIRE